MTFQSAQDLSFCSWVTVSGMTDLAYLVQLMDADLPDTLGDFEALLETACAGAAFVNVGCGDLPTLQVAISQCPVQIS